MHILLNNSQDLKKFELVPATTINILIWLYLQLLDLVPLLLAVATSAHDSKARAAAFRAMGNGLVHADKNPDAVQLVHCTRQHGFIEAASHALAINKFSTVDKGMQFFIDILMINEWPAVILCHIFNSSVNFSCTPRSITLDQQLGILQGNADVFVKR